MPSDDTMLIMPNILGVFDGATSATVGKKSPGRIAADAAASAMGELAISSRLFDMDISAICGAIRDRMIKESEDVPPEVYLATTMASAIFAETEVRLVVIGDSGIRVNGRKNYRHLKQIDEITTNARVETFKILANKHDDELSDAVELLTRSIAFSGLEKAVKDGHLTIQEVSQILSSVDHSNVSLSDRPAVESYLLTGLQGQKSIANRADVPLGYSVLCRDEIMLEDVIDVILPREDLVTLEIYSDGYFTIPSKGTSIEAWEASFNLAEKNDYHKVGEHKSIKGSTSCEFADDRSLISVSFLREQ